MTYVDAKTKQLAWHLGMQLFMLKIQICLVSHQRKDKESNQIVVDMTMMMQRPNSWPCTCATAAQPPRSAVVALHLRTPTYTYVHSHPASELKKEGFYFVKE